MRASIRYLFSTVGLVALLTGCATQNEPLINDAIPESLQSAMQGSSPSAILSEALGKGGYALDWSRVETTVEGNLHTTRVPLSGIAGQFAVAEEGNKTVFAQVLLFTQNDEVLKKWPVCHKPPGNPANAHTIYVGESAVGTHITKHDDSLGFCGRDADTIKSGYTYAVLTPDNIPLTGSVLYDAKGGLSIEENGESAGMNTLEELLTVKPRIPRKNPLMGFGDKVRSHNNYVRELLGDEAELFLREVPAGTQGMKLDSLDVILQPQGPSGPCGRNGGECSGGKPGGGDPAPTPDPDPPPSPDPDPTPDPGTESDDGSEDDEGDEDDDSPSKSKSGPSYDTAELKRLTDEFSDALDERNEVAQELQAAEGRVAEAQASVEQVKEEERVADERFDELFEAYVNNNTEIAELDAEIDKASDNIAIGALEVGLGAYAIGKRPPGDVEGGLILFGAEQIKESVGDLFSAYGEQRRIARENAPIVEELNTNVDESRIGAEDLSVKQSLLGSAEKSQSFWKTELEFAEDELGRAREDLQGFKDKNGIVTNPFESFSLQHVVTQRR